MSDRIVEIHLNAPPMNALGTASMEQLLADLDAAAGAPVLLTGAGRAFSAGLDLREVASLDDAGMVAFLDLLDRMVAALFQHPAPVVAAVHGHAIAGGAVLALCCDAAVATDSPKARIGLNEVALGLQFPPITFQVVRARLDPRHIGTVLLGAGLHDPAEALRLGLVDAVAPDPVAAARERLSALARHPADATPLPSARSEPASPRSAPRTDRRSWTTWCPSGRATR